MKIVQSVLAALLLCTSAAFAEGQACPDFSKASQIVTCGTSEPADDESPAQVDLIGTPEEGAAFVGQDDVFFYVRERVYSNPSSGTSFDQYAWVTLIQRPDGNPAQYQYLLALNGKDDTIELWSNTSAIDINFDPVLNDPAETLLFSAPIFFGDCPLASTTPTQDGFFVDFAIPLTVLAANGVIDEATPVSSLVFFPATSADSNNYNKDHLECSFPVLPCTENSCNDGNACTTDVCTETGCVANPIEGCVPCEADADCNDSNACSNDLCTDGVCQHALVEGCIACETAETCPTPEGACNQAVCEFGVCGASSIEGCVPCETDETCADGNGCTTDSCVEGKCQNNSVEGCVPCSSAEQCSTSSICNAAVCNEGVCGESPIEGCEACTTDSDCADDNTCSLDGCLKDGEAQEGVCSHTILENCVPCVTASDCTAGQCEIPQCLSGVCSITADPDPTCSCSPRRVEICGDGKDNDCDNLVDCDDPNCSESPLCAQPKEVCGDCIDNDGDGLIDLFDPDCCADPQPATLKREKFAFEPVHKKGLRFKGRFSSAVLEGYDPTTQPTQIQIVDEVGTLFCANFSPENFTSHTKRDGRVVYRYFDKNLSVEGLRKVKIKPRKLFPTVKFNVRGPGGKPNADRRVNYRVPSGGYVYTRLLTGDVCSDVSRLTAGGPVSGTPIDKKNKRYVSPK